MKLKTLPALLLFAFMISLNSVAAPAFKTIDTAQLHSMIVDNAYRLEGGQEKEFTVVDARTIEEYDKAHIFSAISVPVKNFERLTALLPEDRSVQLVVYCDDTAPEASAEWAGMASARGYTNIVIYSEGFSAWKEQHMPTAPLDVSH